MNARHDSYRSYQALDTTEGFLQMKVVIGYVHTRYQVFQLLPVSLHLTQASDKLTTSFTIFANDKIAQYERQGNGACQTNQ